MKCLNCNSELSSSLGHTCSQLQQANRIYSQQQTSFSEKDLLNQIISTLSRIENKIDKNNKLKQELDQALNHIEILEKELE